MLLFVIYMPELMVYFYLHVIYVLNMLFFCLPVIYVSELMLFCLYFIFPNFSHFLFQPACIMFLNSTIHDECPEL